MMFDVRMYFADIVARHLQLAMTSSQNQSAMLVTEPFSSSSDQWPPLYPGIRGQDDYDDEIAAAGGDIHRSGEDDIEIVAIVAFLSVLSLVGTVGNAVVLWVFWARRDRAVATLFIVVLAVIDLTTCLIVVPFVVYMESIRFQIELDAFCKLFQVFYD